MNQAQHGDAARAIWRPSVFAIVILAAAVFIVPIAIWSSPDGHDASTHTQNWVEAARQFRHGILYPRWADMANFGFGDARFIFYPPASWMLGGLLGLALPWRMVPGAFIFIAMFLSGITMFRLAREYSSDRVALAAAVLYLFNPYNLVVVYWRSAYGELLTAALFPLVVLFALRLHARDLRSNAWLALSIAAIWLTNLPGAVIATYTVALIVAVRIFQNRSFALAIAALAAVVLGVCLVAFFVLPAWYEQRWVNIADVMISYATPRQNFLFTDSNDPEHTWVNFQFSMIFCAQMVITALAFLFRKRTPQNATVVRVTAALAFAAGLLMLRVSSPAWRWLPFLRYVQFPWRTMFVLSLATVVLIISAGISWWRLLVFGVPTTAVLAFMLLTSEGSWANPELVPTTVQDVASGKGYVGLTEYTPSATDDSEVAPGQPLAKFFSTDEELPPALGNVRVLRWSPEDKQVRVEAGNPRTLKLRIASFPAWQVRVNGNILKTQPADVDGGILVPIAPGANELSVHFARTWDRTAGIGISIAACLLGVFAVRARGSPARGVLRRQATPS